MESCVELGPRGRVWLGCLGGWSGLGGLSVGDLVPGCPAVMPWLALVGFAGVLAGGLGARSPMGSPWGSDRSPGRPGRVWARGLSFTLY